MATEKGADAVQSAETSESVTNASRSGTPKQKGPKLNSRGVPVTNWSNDKNDPNLRKDIGQDPDGKRNKIVGH